MTAIYFGDSGLNKHQSIEQLVEAMIGELRKERPEAFVVGVQVFLDGMWGHKIDIVANGQKLQVDFVPTTNENLPGWVRLVYGEGVFESQPVKKGR
jgi:hypothetical protein